MLLLIRECGGSFGAVFLTFFFPMTKEALRTSASEKKTVSLGHLNYLRLRNRNRNERQKLNKTNTFASEA